VTRRRLLAPVLAGLVLAAFAVPAASVAAYAHDALVASDPAAGATVAEASAVALTFSADPIAAEGADVVEVVGPDGRYYETDCPALTGPTVTTPVALGPAGEYRVEWKIVSSDGHPVSDEFSFTYAPAVDAAAAAGADAPACARAGTQTQEPAAPDQGEASDPGLWVGLGIGAVVLAGVAVGAWLLIRRPRG